MASDNLRSLVISILLVGLFIFAIMNFGIFLALSNNSGTILENEAINKTFNELTTELEEVQSKAEAQKKSFFADIPVIGELTVILGTIVFVGKGMVEVTGGLFSLIAELIAITLGIGDTAAKAVLGVFSAIMVFSLVLLAWSVYRSGK